MQDFSTLVARIITFFSPIVFCWISVIWGWPIMLVAGSLGWNISFIAACGLGFLVAGLSFWFSILFFLLKTDFNFGEKNNGS